jgi:hypothetical protein
VGHAGDRSRSGRPHEEPAGRVGLVVPNLQLAERGGVEQRSVTGPRDEHDRMVRRDRVHRRPRRLRVIEHAPADPSVDPPTIRRACHRRLQTGQNLVERRIVLDRRRPFEVRSRRLRADMGMSVVDAWNDQAAAGVDHSSRAAGERAHRGIRADGADAFADDGERLGPRRGR